MFRFFSRQAGASPGHTGLSLSIAEKITLVLALAMAPLALASWRAADTVQPAIETAAAEREGLRFLSAIARAEALLRRGGVDAQSAAEMLGNAAARYGDDETASVARGIVAALTRSGPGEVAEARLDLAALRERVRQRSGLEADSEAATAPLIGLALEFGPAAETVLDELAPDVTGRGLRRLSDREASDMLRAIGALDQTLRPLDELAARAMAGDAVVAPLAGELSEARRALSVLSQTMLLASRERRLDDARLGSDFESAASALASLENAARVRLDQGLKARIDRLEGERAFTLLAGALVLMACFLAAWLALMRSVARPIRQLVDVTGSLAGGDYEAEINQGDRADEIGAIARFLEVFRELAQLRMRAEIARQSAESANLAKSQFIANMSHELRTPLNAIIGYAEIMMEDVEPESADGRDLERIHSAARHLLSLINDILDVSKIEAGRMELMVEELDPRALAYEAFETVRPLADKNGSKLVLETPGGVGLAFRTDPMKLKQCLLNLLSNACKFTRGGQIRLTLEPFVKDGAPALRFSVADTGIGMTRAEMNRLFQPFVQGDESVTREYGGTGLGLVLTRHMAHLLGGDVSVASEKGKGAVFTLWVRECAPAAEIAPLASPEGAPDAPVILLIEDEREARELVAAALAPLGFRLIAAPTAAAGLEHARAIRPALILLDINLPDRPGWSVLGALKADAATAEIPVVVLSVDADRRASAELGAAEHLVKPASRDAIAAAVLRLARRCEHAADAADETDAESAQRA